MQTQYNKTNNDDDWPSTNRSVIIFSLLERTVVKNRRRRQLNLFCLENVVYYKLRDKKLFRVYITLEHVLQAAIMFFERTILVMVMFFRRIQYIL